MSMKWWRTKAMPTKLQGPGYALHTHSVVMAPKHYKKTGRVLDGKIMILDVPGLYYQLTQIIAGESKVQYVFRIRRKNEFE